MNDPMVRRVNALVTTFLDLLATLLIAAAAGCAAWVLLVPAAGLLAAGVVVAVFSMLAQHRATPRPPTPVVGDDETITLPGPTDPGNLHVMGR